MTSPCDVAPSVPSFGSKPAATRSANGIRHAPEGPPSRTAWGKRRLRRRRRMVSSETPHALAASSTPSVPSGAGMRPGVWKVTPRGALTFSTGCTSWVPSDLHSGLRGAKPVAKVLFRQLNRLTALPLAGRARRHAARCLGARIPSSATWSVPFPRPSVAYQFPQDRRVLHPRKLRRLDLGHRFSDERPGRGCRPTLGTQLCTPVGSSGGKCGRKCRPAPATFSRRSSCMGRTVLRTVRRALRGHGTRQASDPQRTLGS